MQIEHLPIEKIRDYANNAKAHPAGQVKKIAAAIAEFRWDQPIVVDEDLVIIKGHGRYLAAKELGLKTVPVVIADYLTPAQVRAARIADNKLAESEWFPELLALELKALQEMEFDLSLTGFGEEELAKHLTSCEPLGEMPALPSGDKSPFQEMVFTVLDEQAEQVKKALSLAKKQGPFVSDNLNNNGNALTRICETYSRQYEK